MLNKTDFSKKQIAVVRDAKKYFAGKNVVTRKELHEFMAATYPGRVSSPGFITKNTACKAVDKDGNILRGKYRLPNVGKSKSTKPASTEPKAPRVLSMTKDAIRKRAAAAKKAAANVMPVVVPTDAVASVTVE
jgi:hypothetical protein